MKSLPGVRERDIILIGLLSGRVVQMMIPQTWCEGDNVDLDIVFLLRPIVGEGTQSYSSHSPLNLGSLEPLKSIRRANPYTFVSFSPNPCG